MKHMFNGLPENKVLVKTHRSYIYRASGKSIVEHTVIAGSNIGKAMDMPISHFNELRTRYWEQAWPQHGMKFVVLHSVQDSNSKILSRS